MLLVFLSLVEYAIILRRIVIHQRNIEKWRQDQIKEKRHDAGSEVDIYFNGIGLIHSKLD